MRPSCVSLLATLPLLVPSLVQAQGTDIYLFDIEGDYALVARVTDREGYDSQPAFTADSRALLFSSDREGGQIDLFRYDLESGGTSNLTRTPDTNEFSPQPSGADRFSYVLQEGNPYQNVWSQGWDGSDPRRVLTSFIPVGYYARNDAGVLIWARYAMSLFFEPAGAEVGPGAGESLYLISQAGISIHAIPGTDAFSFVHKQSDWTWMVKTFEPATKAITPLVAISNANENYCWTPGGVMLTAEGTRILRFRPGVDEAWQPEARLRAPELGAGGRCAVSPDGRYLALVSQRGP
jgi:hypothetical protein